MTDETNAPELDSLDAPAEPVEEAKIMCYVSKMMVPLSQTVEIEYEKGTRFRVQPKYIKYSQNTDA